MSRRPKIGSMYLLEMNLWWDGNVLDLIHNGNDPALLALSTLENLNDDDAFLSQLKGAYSTYIFSLMRILIGGRDRRLRKHPTDRFGITVVL